MSDLKRMEDMLSILIEMVGKNNEDLQGVKQELNGVKQDLNGVKQDLNGVKQELAHLKNDFTEEKEKNALRHKQVLTKLTELRIDQDFIWEKAVINEREIAKIKNQFQMK